MVLALERLGQKGFAFIVVGQLGDGGILVQLEGQDVLRLELAGELAAQHGGVAAVGTVGGGGGGRPNMAQAGGKDPNGIDAALAQAVTEAQAQLS